MRIVKLNEESKKDILNTLLKRSPNNYDSYADTVNEIVNNVRQNGDKAVAEYTLKFDKTEVTSDNIMVTAEEIKEAYDYINANDEGLVEVIKKSATNIREYHSKQIKDMIRRQEKKYGWEFLFVAANIDAVETAESIGIRKERAANYNVEEDTGVLFAEMSDTICEYRTTGAIRKDWAKNIEKNNKKPRK